MWIWTHLSVSLQCVSSLCRGHTDAWVLTQKFRTPPCTCGARLACALKTAPAHLIFHCKFFGILWNKFGRHLDIKELPPFLGMSRLLSSKGIWISGSCPYSPAWKHPLDFPLHIILVSWPSLGVGLHTVDIVLKDSGLNLGGTESEVANLQPIAKCFFASHLGKLSGSPQTSWKFSSHHAER